MIRNPPVGAGGSTPTLPILTSGQFGLPADIINITGLAAHTLSPWTDLGTLSEPIDKLLLDLIYNSSGRAVSISLRHGGTTLIVDRLIAQTVGAGPPTQVPLPIRIPAGPLQIQVASNSAGNLHIGASAVKSSVPQNATSISLMTPYNVANLLSSGTNIPITSTAGTWNNIGSPTSADAKGLIFSMEKGGAFSSRTPGQAVVQISLDGSTPLYTTVVWQTATQFALPPRVFEHGIPAGSQVRMRAFVPGAGAAADVSNVCMGLIQ